MAKAMEYTETPIKNNLKAANDKMLVQSAEKLSSARLLWIVVTRHKVGLLILGNVAWLINWAIPAWPQIILSLV